tara:strand:+ start:2432 stop:3166 length:735 start_codon:yes stop_codon:yes gene_type:complete
MSILIALQTAFSLYMLVHAARQGAPPYWWIIIMMPFGEWAYFLAVYLPARKKSASFAKSFVVFSERPPSLEVLYRSHRHTPSHDNKLRLAQGLFDAGKLSDSNELFSELLQEDANDTDALFGYAQSCVALGDTDAASRAFEHLLDLQLEYRSYSAAYQLCRQYWKEDREADCIKLLQRICKKTQRLEPRLELARYLIALDRHPEARDILEGGLDSLAGSPAHAQRQQRISTWKAKRILRDMPRP